MNPILATKKIALTTSTHYKVQRISKNPHPLQGTAPRTRQDVAQIEFTRDGRYALASLWEMDGARIVYDAETLEEVKRIR
jgi:hypothetical protein